MDTDFTVPKLSVKSVCGSLSMPDKKTDLMRIVGIVRKYRMGDSDTGPQLVLLGYFYAQNLATKETFYSERAVLPDEVGEWIKGAMDCYEVWTSIEFDLVLGMRPDTTLAGMRWVISANTVKEHDPLVHVVRALLQEFGSTKRSAGSKKNKTTKIKSSKSKAAPPAAAAN